MVDPARLCSMAIVAAVVVLGGTACSSSSGDGKSQAGQAQVATLQSAGPSSAPSSAAARPRQRLDETAADYEALIKPYDDCMKRHGLNAKGFLPGSGLKQPSAAVAAAAKQECNPLIPLPAWELDPANPEAKDFARAVVQCLKGKGVKFVEVNPDGPGWSFGGPQNDQQSISKGMDLSPACEREVAAKK